MMFKGDCKGEGVRNQEAAPPLRVSLPGNQVDGLPGIAVLISRQLGQRPIMKSDVGN